MWHISLSTCTDTTLRSFQLGRTSNMSDSWRRGEHRAGGQGPAGTPNETARLPTHSQLNTEPKFVEGQRCGAAALT